MDIAEQVKDFFHKEGIHSTTIQPEFIDVCIKKGFLLCFIRLYLIF
jgi:zinc transporter 1